MSSTPQSDLIDKVHHEHQHLAMMFEDIRSTFAKITSGELEGERRQEVLQSAADDLELGLDEMLHHFDQEEEVFFVEIEKRFPELSDDIAQLVAAHEFICARTKQLKALVARDSESVAKHADKAFEMIQELQEALVNHTRDENQIFSTALKAMAPEERRRLLSEMQKI